MARTERQSIIQSGHARIVSYSLLLEPKGMSWNKPFSFLVSRLRVTLMLWAHGISAESLVNAIGIFLDPRARTTACAARSSTVAHVSKRGPKDHSFYERRMTTYMALEKAPASARARSPGLSSH